MRTTRVPPSKFLNIPLSLTSRIRRQLRSARSLGCLLLDVRQFFLARELPGPLHCHQRYQRHPCARKVWLWKGYDGVATHHQVWSLTQFYSVDFSQSRIGVNKCIFYKRTIKICVSCCCWCPGTSAPSAAHLTVSLYLCSSKAS